MSHIVLIVVFVGLKIKSGLVITIVITDGHFALVCVVGVGIVIAIVACIAESTLIDVMSAVAVLRKGGRGRGRGVIILHAAASG